LRRELMMENSGNRREGSARIDNMRGKVLRAAERRAKAETEYHRAVEWEKALRWDLGLLLREYADNKLPGDVS
jgi:hypothetical protein